MPRSASIRDHVRPRHHPSLQNEVFEERFKQLRSPVVYNQSGLYWQLRHQRHFPYRKTIVGPELLVDRFSQWHGPASVSHLDCLHRAGGFGR